MAEDTLGLFTDDTKLEYWEYCSPFERDLRQYKKWAGRSFMMFSSGKRNILHLRKNSPVHQCTMLEDRQLESRLAGKDLGVWVDTKLNLSQRCAIAPKGTLLGKALSAGQRR